MTRPNPEALDDAEVAARALRVSRQRYEDSAATFRSVSSTSVMVGMYLAFAALPWLPGTESVVGHVPPTAALLAFGAMAISSLVAHWVYQRRGAGAVAYQRASTVESALWLGTAAVLAVWSGQVVSMYQAQPMLFVVLLSGSTWRFEHYRVLLALHVGAVTVGFATTSLGSALAASLLGGVWLLLNFFSVRAGRHLDDAQARAQLLAERLVLHERERIARELHDGLAGDITQVLWLVSSTRTPEAEELMRRLRDTLASLRGLTARVRTEPTELRQIGRDVRRRAREMATAAGVEIEVDLDLAGPEAQVSPAMRDAIVSGSSELVRNAIAHGRAQHVFVELSVEEDVWLRVSDDGVGGSAADGGEGLGNLRSRVAELGGQMTVEAADTGWQVVLTWPMATGVRSGRASVEAGS